MAEPVNIEDVKADAFDAWLDVLREDVIQNDYGYEPGEFAVYPELWRPLFDEGVTPAQAFKRALDQFGAERREADAAQAANWARIQQADADAIAAWNRRAMITAAERSDNG